MAACRVRVHSGAAWGGTVLARFMSLAAREAPSMHSQSQFMTYLLDRVNVRCDFGLAFQEENVDYPAHESECPPSALRPGRKKKTRG